MSIASALLLERTSQLLVTKICSISPIRTEREIRGFEFSCRGLCGVCLIGLFQCFSSKSKTWHLLCVNRAAVPISA